MVDSRGGTAPLGARVVVGLSYSLWSYLDGQSAHIAFAHLEAALSARFRGELRYWFAAVVQPPSGAVDPAAVTHSLGLRGFWRLAPTVEVGAEYTYGGQLDRDPRTLQLIELRSQILGASLDWLINPRFGLRPGYRFESRERPRVGDSIPIHTLELGTYFRW